MSEWKTQSEIKRVQNIFPHFKNYIDKACNEGEEFPTDNYKKFMLITDYVSGMTDTYALNLYQELTGKPLY